LLLTLPSPYPKALACPFTLKMLRVKERTPTPHSSIVFTLDSHLNLLRSLGVHQYHIAHWNCGISQPQNPLEYGLWHDTLTHCLSLSSSWHIMEPIRSHTCTWNNYRRGNCVKMWTMCPTLYTIKVSHKIMMDNIATYNLANTPTCSCGINIINKVNITF